MDLTVVCYLKKNDKYLMLYRNKKENDYNHGKWITIGGHVELNEDIDSAMIREVKEESGYNILDYKLLGTVEFTGDFKELMYVYISESFDGIEIECDEGELGWFTKNEILKLNMWEGDYKFINHVFNNESFNIKLTYNNNILINTEIK